jgi:predicted TIM-barrel fold metal-dependent hydrolase
MEMNDLILISIDDHLMEPGDFIDRHIPARYRERAPRLVKQANGLEAWMMDGQTFGTWNLNAVVGRPREEYGMEPISYSQIRRGCWDVKARIDDMNANGVFASMNFPSLPRTGGSLFTTHVKDRDFALAVIRAYNDWHILEWCGAYPARFIPMGIVPLWDAELAAAEVRRLAAMNTFSITFPDNPTAHGLPSVHDASWDPLWKACAEHNVIINCHIGSGNVPAYASLDMPIDAWITTMPMAVSLAAADWLFAPMWQKFPSLKMSLSEGGIGWVPYFLERADFAHEHHKAWTHTNLGGKKPSEVFRKHFITCFIHDAVGLEIRSHIGVDHIMWECDYPHSDCTWPDSPDETWEVIKGLPRADIDKITHLNAMREYHFEPFKHIPKEEATVGALRAQASHVDTRPVANMGGIKPSERPKTTVRARDVMAQLAHMKDGDDKAAA